MSDHTPDPSDAYERPEVFDLTPNAITATQPWETDGTSLALTAASLLNELRPLAAAALDWDDARRAAQAAPASDEAWARYTAAADVTRERLDALSEDAHLWARGEALVDDRPSTFAVGPAPESVFDCEEGDQLGGWPEPFHRTVDLAAALGVPSDRSIYFGLALVAAEMARLLDVYADGADSMEHKQEAADALDAFRSLRSAALAELISKPGAAS
jgi:hypothetical protein